jgi:DNA segregation ATPase FtsK/SpoIIIE-like protein
MSKIEQIKDLKFLLDNGALNQEQYSKLLNEIIEKKETTVAVMNKKKSEFVGEDGGINLEMDISERDTLFRVAAEVIVNAQQGSASLLQRKLKLGYNRAGRLIDQLEATGIVGPFEGSKARTVNIQDMTELNTFFEKETESPSTLCIL